MSPDAGPQRRVTPPRPSDQGVCVAADGPIGGLCHSRACTRWPPSRGRASAGSQRAAGPQSHCLRLLPARPGAELELQRTPSPEPGKGGWGTLGLSGEPGRPGVVVEPCGRRCPGSHHTVASVTSCVLLPDGGSEAAPGRSVGDSAPGNGRDTSSWVGHWPATPGGSPGLWMHTASRGRVVPIRSLNGLRSPLV